MRARPDLRGRATSLEMKKLFLSVLLAAAAGLLFAQSPMDFVGTWKSDPGGPAMMRKIELDGKTIINIGNAGWAERRAG